MDNFTFYAPTYFAFGKGAETQTGELVRRFGGTKVLIHYGGTSVKKNGALDAVVAALDGAKLPHVELGGVKPNPRSGLVREGIELCRREGIDFVLAVGGGSVIDSSKAIALGTLYDGDFWDFFGGRFDPGKPAEHALPVGTVLTIAAAGSEGSPTSVITREEGLLKRAAHGDVLRPRFAIMNPAFTCSLSAWQTASGITDIMAHVCERYFTNTRDVEVTDRLCEGILKTIIAEAPKVMSAPADYQARANIMWAGMVAHNNLCGTGRVQDWASHAIEHELSALYDVTHGAGLAVIMPAWMRYVMRHDINRFAQFAVRVWGCDMDFARPEKTAAQGIERFRHFLDSLGMPSTFTDIGAKEEDIPLMVKILGATKEHPIGNFVPLDDDAVAAIYRLAL